MKRLLLLGGLKYLVPVIKKAKRMGVYIITCDYKPDNIAHKYSDEYYNISIVDREAVLSLAIKLNIDGIMSFAVDPGVLTAAYVSDKMGLPSPGPYESIEILQNKGLFRNFLAEHNFNVPASKSFDDIKQAVDEFNFNLPVIVKPVDSAGSKGVSRVDKKDELETAINYAIKQSPTKTFIIEDFLEAKGYPSDTDCFSVNGYLDFITFSDQRFDSKAPNPYTPSGFTWPSTMHYSNQKYLKKELQRLVQLLRMHTSIYNVEVRVAMNGKPYIMELSPRGGGNRLAEMIEIVSGVDLITYNIKAALGEKIEGLSKPKYKSNIGQFILHSNRSGIYNGLIVHDSIKKYLVEVDLWVTKGDRISAFKGANDSIGTIVLKFDDQSILEHVLNNYSDLIKIGLLNE